jgi:hypothetical protein
MDKITATALIQRGITEELNVGDIPVNVYPGRTKLITIN